MCFNKLTLILLCRTIVDHLVRSGSSTTSQQQQPLHEVKTIAQQNANSLQTVEAMLKVKMTTGHPGHLVYTT